MAQGSSSPEAAAPADLLSRHRTGTALVSSFQSTGIEEGSTPGALRAHPHNADALAVFESRERLTAAELDARMNALQDRAAAGQVFRTGTSGDGSTAALAHLQEEGGPGRFKVVAGELGDSQVMVARVNASGQVTDLSRVVPGGSPFVFGETHIGSNAVGERSIELARGERAFVIAASDGLTDGHIALATRGTVLGASGQPARWQDVLRSDIESALRADPSGNNLSSHLALSAAGYGARDNVTVSSVALSADTSLGGKSLTMAVFDGVGHEDGRFSSHLARDFQQVMGGQTPELVQRQEMVHMARREPEVMAAVRANQAHFEATQARPAAPEAAAPKTEGPRADPPKAPKPAAAAPVKAARAVVGAAGKINKAGGRVQAAADAAVKLAGGDVAGAAASAGTAAGFEALQSHKAAELAGKAGAVAVDAAEKSGGKLATALGAAKLVGKRIPGVGALVTLGFGVAAVGSLLIDGQYRKAGVEAVASAAEAGGNIVGFGVGDAAREGVRGAALAAGGREYEVAKSGLRELGESAVDLVTTRSAPVSSYVAPPPSNVAPTRAFNKHAALLADMAGPVPLEPQRRPTPSGGMSLG